IDVGHDADVAIVLERGGTRHSLQQSRKDGKSEWSSKKTAGPGTPRIRREPVSIRCRRVHSPLLRDGDPGAPVRTTRMSHFTGVELAALLVGSADVTDAVADGAHPAHVLGRPI